MTADRRTAAGLLAAVQADLAPGDGENRLLPMVATGRAPRSLLGVFAAEQTLIVTADRGSILHLAGRTSGGPAGEFFDLLAVGESAALATLPAMAAAAGLDGEAVRDHEPLPGCQAYPAYLSWLALHGDPAAVIVAMVANFAAWGGYCGELGRALRAHYGFDDEACGFVDFFAADAPELHARAVRAVQAALDAGQPLRHARRYGRLLQAYELMFWSTLAG
jgi:hypothetical protein